MKFKKRILSFFLSVSLLFSGCAGISIPTNADAAFENFTRTLFLQDVASSTLGLHYTLQNPDAYGIKESPVTFGTFDTDMTTSLAALENCKATLDKFPYKALSKENQITYDVLSSHIEQSKKGVSYILYDEPLSPLTGIHAQLPVLLAEYSFCTKEDVDTYLKLIETTPEYFSSLIAFEKEKANAGLFMADSTLKEVLEQCQAFVAMGENNYLLSTFEERLNTLPSLSENEKRTYTERNRELITTAVLPAYEQLICELQELNGNGNNELGLCYLPAGKDYYAFLASREIGSSRPVEEMLSLIEQQITQDILDIQQVLEGHPEITEEASATSSDSPELILKDLEEKISDSFPASEEVSIEIKYVPTDLEPYLSPAFYLIPSIDNTTENVIYINNAHSMEDILLFTTLAHEGYPGHLYQTTYYASKKPDPLRTLFNFKGYVEGWATYAEMCSYYLSNLEKPYATLLQKNNSLILGLYARADIGIHHQGWDLDRTTQFFKTYGIEDNETIQEIYQLIIGDPANYLSYYMGYVEILELKREVIEKEGTNFSQKNFHQGFLDVGPATFEIVREQLLG